jgi:exosortase J
MMVPLVSLVLILRAWRGLDWEADGTWWGFVVLVVTAAVVWVREHAILILVVSPNWSTVLPPPSLVLLAYGSGVVLLLGGTRLYRAALFPVLLLWFANPVPSRFSLLIDMPLQRVSAHIARAFAMHLGHTLTPDHLRLMFTPAFGMFIAPGCDGIRGSVTMGFVALIAGYIYRFRWYASALVVIGAILLGYVFNLVRLCMLVLYYIIALHFPSLQDKAENADYVIGAGLFLFATLLLFTVVHHLRDARNSTVLEAATVSEYPGFHGGTQRGQIGRLGAMVAVALLGCAGLARAHAAFLPSNRTIANAGVGLGMKPWTPDPWFTNGPSMRRCREERRSRLEYRPCRTGTTQCSATPFGERIQYGRGNFESSLRVLLLSVLVRPSTTMA